MAPSFLYRNRYMDSLGADVLERPPHESLTSGEASVRSADPRKKLQPASAIFSDVSCDICGKSLPAGTPVICMPSNDGNWDPWACEPCVSADPSYVISKDWDDYLHGSPCFRAVGGE